MKEPKLLAEIRANKARVEKGAKSPRRAPDIAPGSAMLAVEIVTPETPAPPNNYVAQTLDECTTVAHCEELLAHAKQHGFSEEGQTVKLIRARIAEFSRGATPSAKKRGARR